MKTQKVFSVMMVSILLLTFGCAGIGAQGVGTTDESFLLAVQKKSFEYFKECSNPELGLVQDRAHNFMKLDEARWHKQYLVASVAASGFYLSAYVIADQNGWASHEEAQMRVLNTLRFFHDKMEHVNGFYYHFVDLNSGKRSGSSELSSIDTALFLAGVIHAREYFADNAEIQQLSTALFERVDWKWMTNNSSFLSMGWRPDRKGGRFLDRYWDHYSECLMMYLMAMGSPTKPIPADGWRRLARSVKRYGDHVCIAYSALFVHQYSHIWVDFRDKNDGMADYFKNSTTATLANREFCLDQSVNFKTYEENVWGLTACDGPSGYKAYGGKPGYENHDGTVAPTAAAGSIVFTPEYSIAALKTMYQKYKKRLWGHYGFSDAFNVDKDFFGKDCIAIDQGAMLLMIENYRNQSIWKVFMKNPWIQAGMERVGFVPGSIDLTLPKPPELVALRTKNPVILDGDMREWDLSRGFPISRMNYEYGRFDNKLDFDGKIYFAWDEKNLYFAMKVKDNAMVSRKGGSFIFKDDCVEFYVDPAQDGLVWGDATDVQLGISPDTKKEGGQVRSWAWFQNYDAVDRGLVQGKWQPYQYGYVLEAAISFEALKISPARPASFSVSLHDQDESETSSGKLTTFFEDWNGKDGRRLLGRIVFE